MNKTTYRISDKHRARISLLLLLHARVLLLLLLRRLRVDVAYRPLLIGRGLLAGWPVIC